MPPVIKTLAQIQADLNGPNNVNGIWIRVPDVYGVSVPGLPTQQGGAVNFLSGQKGIVLVAFVNTRNGEVRFFLAKYTDAIERNNL